MVLVGFPDMQALDLVGPMEVFRGAAQAVPGAYEVRVAAPGARRARDIERAHHPGVRRCSRGGHRHAAGVRRARRPAASRDERLIGWLREAAGQSRRVASVCSGALLLARAGLLDGRRATTHWSVCRQLAERYPQVTVEPDAIFVRDGPVWTSAGVTAGMDLALALVEEDLGREVALEVARWLVLFVKRPAASRSSPRSSRASGRGPAARALTEWVGRHLAADLRVEALAERACMSPRNFSRGFRRETGMTPAKYVELARVQAARQYLADTADGVDSVAARCGFGTAETMRRAFHRHLGIGPADYRARFSSAFFDDSVAMSSMRGSDADHVPAVPGVHSA